MKKLGLVGVGAIAQTYLKALETASFARITAVADLRADAARGAAEAHRATAYASHVEMAEQAGLDAVIVSTPPSTHPEIARAFLERGIPVLVEKPVAIDEAGARAILSAGQRSGTFVTMASKFRYVDDVIRARALISAGMLGDIQLMENVFAAPVKMVGRWNADPKVSGGGVLVDNGTHSVDIVRYLLGPITEVDTIIVDTFDKGLAVDDNVQMFVATETGAKVRIDLSWTFDKQLANYISLYGTHGVAHIGWKESRYKLAGASDWVVFGQGYDKFAAFRANVENFCQAIDGRAPSLITFDDALASVEAIRAAYQSAVLRAPVRLVAKSIEPVAADMRNGIHA